MNTRIGVFTPELSTGGVGKMRVHLVTEMVRRGFAVDLLLASTDSPLFASVPPEVRIVKVGTTHPYYSLPSLYNYFRNCAPEALVTDRLRLNIACQRARALARSRSRLCLSVHNPLSIKFDGGVVGSKGQSMRQEFLRWAPRNHRIIAVSRGVAEDLVERVGVAESLVRVVNNPVITPALEGFAQATVTHPYFNPKSVPVILSAGRMTEQKDFPTLLRAFREVRAQRPCRLLILGKHGSLYQELLALIHSLGIADDVSLPGFDPNPYKYMAKSDVYVLSSRWEGFGNVIVEALATGLPVVATDCPVGPREILGNESLGRLVPIGDVRAMAEAIGSVLRAPPDRAALMSGVRQYSVQKSVEGYLEAFGLQ